MIEQDRCADDEGGGTTPTETGRLAQSLACASCRYDLYRQSVESNCPECGVRVRDTLEALRTSRGGGRAFRWLLLTYIVLPLYLIGFIWPLAAIAVAMVACAVRIPVIGALRRNMRPWATFRMARWLDVLLWSAVAEAVVVCAGPLAAAVIDWSTVPVVTVSPVLLVAGPWFVTLLVQAVVIVLLGRAMSIHDPTVNPVAYAVRVAVLAGVIVGTLLVIYAVGISDLPGIRIWVLIGMGLLAGGLIGIAVYAALMMQIHDMAVASDRVSGRRAGLIEPIPGDGSNQTLRPSRVANAPWRVSGPSAAGRHDDRSETES